MASNRGVAYIKPGVVEVQSIDFPTLRHPDLAGIGFGTLWEVSGQGIGNSGISFGVAELQFGQAFQ
jgi:hypothetical protein